jgi:hypothetical protein
VVERLLPDSYVLTFNGWHYDLRILMFAINRRTLHQTWEGLRAEVKLFSDLIINGPQGFDKEFVKLCDEYRWYSGPNLDLKNVLGGRTAPSLKKIACRLHLPDVEALPVDPDAILTDEQKSKIIAYNKLDVLNTLRLYRHCRPLLDMRRSLSRIYRTDCTSLSDAQIAERIMGGDVPRDHQGGRFSAEYPRLIKGFLHPFRYETAQLRNFFEYLNGLHVRFKQTYNPVKKKQVFQKFFEDGDRLLPSLKLDDLVPAVDFKFGGLHSVHKKSKAVRGDGAYDVDVASYYPHLILRFGIFPEAVGERFLDTYQGVLDRRLQAKREGNKTEADALKIVLNSVFGKYNEWYSKLFDPLAGASVCLHGQCGLLRLMDLCFQAGVGVLLVNTDGIITKEDPAQVVQVWQDEMRMTLEVKPITKYVIKDSNNHILKYKDGSLKVKGVSFSYEPSAGKQTNFSVTRRALVENLMNDVPIEDTIYWCSNLHEFTAVYARGPSILEIKKALDPQDPGEPQPDLVRYYLGKDGDHHVYRRNARGWTRVADSRGFVCCNQMPTGIGLPRDLDHNRYIAMTENLLRKL